MSDLQSTRGLIKDSGMKIAFIKNNITNEIIPVLLLIDQAISGEDYGRVWSKNGNGQIKILSTDFNTATNNIEITSIQPDNSFINFYTDKNNPGDWLLISQEDLNSNNYQIIYPRVGINSLGLRTDSEELILKYFDKQKKNETIIDKQLSLLTTYEDYSILTRSLTNEYLLTLKNDLILQNNYDVVNNQIIFDDKPLKINYSISNADIGIYLDALQVAKENSQPKISYSLKTQLINLQLINNIYNKMGYIAHINDYDLKFNNVRGYISGFTLDLDNPSQDTIEIKNYKTKFEDLFSTITAQTEAMKKNSYTIQMASSILTSSGDLTEEVLQSSISKVDLNYAFNNGKLTIDEKNGIWGTSDSGVVAFRGGGIFTATEKNADNTWKWNTGITPQGINADLITTGQLDTNLIKIYAGDHLRFQMNGDGIFAYKSWLNDSEAGAQHPMQTQNSEITNLDANDSLDYKQYVVFNDNGLSLIAKRGARVLINNNTQYYTVLNEDVLTQHPELFSQEEIKRVQVSWKGFVLRNWLNQEVFFADPETGNLTLKGRIEADSGKIGAWEINQYRLFANTEVSRDEDGSTYNTYVALNAGGNKQEPIGDTIVDTTPYCFWAGNQNPKNAAFTIKKNGAIRATYGSIGGWSISSQYLYSDQVTLAGAAVDNSTFSGSAEIYGTQERQVSGQENELDTTIITHITAGGNETLYPIIYAYPEKTSRNPAKSFFIVTDTGYVMAKDFYILKYDSQNSTIVNWSSISSWINSVEQVANTASTTAATANLTANTAYTWATAGYSPKRVTSIWKSGDKIYYTYDYYSNGTVWSSQSSFSI